MQLSVTAHPITRTTSSVPVGLTSVICPGVVDRYKGAPTVAHAHESLRTMHPGSATFIASPVFFVSRDIATNPLDVVSESASVSIHAPAADRYTVCIIVTGSPAFFELVLGPSAVWFVEGSITNIRPSGPGIPTGK